MSASSGDDGERSREVSREQYVKNMSDRLHDRFLERPAFLDLEFIRTEIKKLDSQIDESLAKGASWETVQVKLGDPTEYADAVFASRLLSPAVDSRGSRPSVVMTVLKILFVIAPVNFLLAIWPLLLGFVILVMGWVASGAIVIVPILLLVHFALESMKGVGAAEVCLLIGVFAFGQLMALLMMIVSRLLFWCIWAWLGWNISFLRAEPRR